MSEAEKPLQANDAARNAGAERVYVNHVELNATLSEVRIDFGQLFADAEFVRTQCRLVTSPVHLRRMGQEISATIATYETRFGTIPADERVRMSGNAAGVGDG